MGAVLLFKRKKPAWDRRRFQLNQANLYAQAMPNFPLKDRPACVREILRLAKAALSHEGAA